MVQTGRQRWLWWCCTLLSATATAQVTRRVSISTSGVEGDGASRYPSSSRDGTFIAFESDASNLVAGDTNGYRDIFLCDCSTGELTRVSVDSQGREASGPSTLARISPDGRLIAFTSFASNLVPGDTNSVADVFVHDRISGETTCVSVAPDGAPGDHESGVNFPASFSEDDRYVAFDSAATNLVAGDTNNRPDAFRHDLVTHRTLLVSVDSSGIQGNGVSDAPILSGNGAIVAFSSLASNLVQDDNNRAGDGFVHDMASGETTRVTVSSSGQEGSGSSAIHSISEDGSVVVFASHSENIVLPDANGNALDVLVHDRRTHQTTRVSVDSNGAQGNASSGELCSDVSRDGRFVVFESVATNLVDSDTNAASDVFVHDRATGQTRRVSVDDAGNEGNAASGSKGSCLSRDGRHVVFSSLASNLAQGDHNGMTDTFDHARLFLDWTGDPKYQSPFQYILGNGNSAQTGNVALVMLSCSGISSTRLPSGQTLSLTFDACTTIGLLHYSLLQGRFSPTGTARTPLIAFPDAPGILLYAAAVTLDPQSGRLVSVLEPIWFLTQ